MKPLGESVGEDVPEEVKTACAEAADRYWLLKPGSCVALGGRRRPDGLCGVSVGGGPRRGVCVATEAGDILFLYDV